jgi:hypothetical protein
VQSYLPERRASPPSSGFPAATGDRHLRYLPPGRNSVRPHLPKLTILSTTASNFSQIFFMVNARFLDLDEFVTGMNLR